MGHVILCGALHVAYQAIDGINGQYMLCALFKSFLVLAVGDKGLETFSVVASIPLVNVSLEDADNGRGISSAQDAKLNFSLLTFPSGRNSMPHGAFFLESRF